MYIRPEQNYTLSDALITAILKDAAQPHNQIAKTIPDNAVVLDIGAGSGTLSRVLKGAGKNVTIDGVEPNSFAAELAKPYYRRIFTGYAQEYFPSIKATAYDYVVLADVIEHISDPADFLRQLLANLSKSTKILISVPNIAFGGSRLALLNGHFDYVDSGLLERTHLRFFTLANALKLFSLVDLLPERVVFLERSFYRMEFNRDCLRASPLEIWKLAVNHEARAYQYLFLLTNETDIATRREHVGTKAINILFDAIFARSWIKNIILARRKA